MKQPKPKEQEQPEYLASCHFPDSGRIAEMVWNGSAYSYLIRNSFNSETTRADFITVAGKRTVPPPIRQFLLNHLVYLPSAADSYGTQEELAAEVIRFLHKYNDIPQWWEQLIAHYILMSWVYDRFTAVPYLRILGTHGTGKTRILLTTGSIAYKGTIVSGSIGGAGIFRISDKVRGTLCIDESEFKGDAATEIVKILNNRYMDGLATVRCDGANYDTNSYYNYGPTVFTARAPFEDESLESRCLTLHTAGGTIRPDVPYQLPKEFYSESQTLRNKLLRWRFDRFDQITADESRMREMMPRLGQIGSTLYSVSTDEKFRNELIRFLTSEGEEQSSCSEAAATVLAVSKFVNGKPTDLKVSQIAARMNSMASDYGFEILSSRKIGTLLRNIGFKPTRMRSGYRFRVTPEEIRKLKAKYPMGKEG